MVDRVDAAGTGGLVKVADACRRLGVSPATVYRMVAAGALPAVRVGLGRGAIRFDPADLAAYVAAGRVAAAPPPARPRPPGADAHAAALRRLEALSPRASAARRPRPGSSPGSS